MPSGADLEYLRMLAKAGISQPTSQGFDGARLEQLGDSVEGAGIIADTQLPSRLRNYALNISDANLAVNSGNYILTNTSANRPPGNAYWYLQVISNSTYVFQIANLLGVGADATTKYARELNYDGVWGPWYVHASSQSQMDARYALGGKLETPGLNMPNVYITGLYSIGWKIGTMVTFQGSVSLQAGPLDQVYLQVPYPVHAGTMGTAELPLGHIRGLRAGAAWYHGAIVPDSSNNMRLRVVTFDGTGNPWNANTPVVWQANDQWHFNLTYQAAY